MRRFINKVVLTLSLLLAMSAIIHRFNKIKEQKPLSAQEAVMHEDVPALQYALAHSPHTQRELAELWCDCISGSRRSLRKVLKPYFKEVNLYSSQGETPLNSACSNYDSGDPIPDVLWLLEQGADPNLPTTQNPDPHLPDTDGYYPIFWACDYRKQPTQKLLPLLLRYHARLDVKDREGRSVTHWAAAIGDAKVMRYVLQNGADPNAISRKGITPLEEALGKSEIVSVLLKAGVKREAVCKQRKATILQNLRNHVNIQGEHDLSRCCSQSF